MSPEQKIAIKGIVGLFDRAEDKVKEVELLAQELSIPAINELRYVGYHLARSLCEDSPEQLNIQINKAERHCKRAIYDAHGIGIIHLLEQLMLFKEKYTSFSNAVITIMPSYTDDLTCANKASKFIAQIKEENRGSRDSYYMQCEPHYQSLRDIIDKLSIAEPLINQKITEDRESEQKETRRFITIVVLSILAITVSISIAVTTT